MLMLMGVVSTQSVVGLIIAIALIVIFIALVAANVIVVPQASAFVMERLGAYQSTWETGLHFKIPLIEKISNKVTLKERVAIFCPSRSLPRIMSPCR